jgi:transcriptional regulator with XRE-family HTH domain
LTVDQRSFTLSMVSDVTNDSSNLSNSPGGASELVSVVGDNVRRLRERTGLSLRELAARAGISASTLSSLEAGTGNPGLETLVGIAGALGVPFGELVVVHEAEVHVQRADEGPVVTAREADFASRLLVTTGRRGVTEVYEATLEPGEEYTAEPHLPGVVESVYVTHGRVRVGPPGAAVVLGPGDRATFAADQPHVYEALEPASRAVLVLAYS